MAEVTSTIPANVVNPLGVTVADQRTALLYRSKRRGHNKLSLALADNGLAFHETDGAPVILRSGRTSENLTGLDNLFLSQVMHEEVLTYSRNGQLQLARRAELDEFDIGLWEHLPARLPGARAGLIVSEFKTNGRYVLYYSNSTIGVAFSRDLIHWQASGRPVLSTRPDHFDRAHLKIIGTQLTARGILVTYEALTYRKRQQTLSIGAALLARHDPAQVLWRSDQPLWGVDGSRASGEHAIGAVIKDHVLLVYLTTRRGGWRVVELPLPPAITTTPVEAAHVLQRHAANPIITPEGGEPWEAAGTFNPAAVIHDGQVHLFYRALGDDGISRIGYSVSQDGLTFERSSQPVYDHGAGFVPEPQHHAVYSRRLHASGGGWGGTEDPRAVIMGDKLYVSFGLFESWQSMRIAVTTLPLDELHAKNWVWSTPLVISPAGETHKNWVLFSEKIHGQFAILHALTPDVQIEYVEHLSDLKDKPIQSNNQRGGRAGAWDGFVRGAAAPPLKTAHGWLLLYHGMDPAEPGIGYKVGAMLLDLDEPTKVLYRSKRPLLVPSEWYENDWKPGVVYASGAVIQDDTLYIYYGGGDRHVCVATAQLTNFIAELTSDHSPHLNAVEMAHVLR